MIIFVVIHFGQLLLICFVLIQLTTTTAVYDLVLNGTRSSTAVVLAYILPYLSGNGHLLECSQENFSSSCMYLSVVTMYVFCVKKKRSGVSFKQLIEFSALRVNKALPAVCNVVIALLSFVIDLLWWWICCSGGVYDQHSLQMCLWCCVAVECMCAAGECMCAAWECMCLYLSWAEIKLFI